MSEENDLREIAERLPESQLRDHARSAVISAVNLLPFGGTLSALLSEYLPNWKLNRIHDFFEKLGDDLERLKDRVDEEQLRTEQYGLMLEHVMRQVAQTTGEAKLEAYRAILLNGAISSSPNEVERAYFVSRVDALQELHLIILTVIHAVANGDSQRADESRASLNSQEDDVVESAYGDLEQMNFVRRSANAVGHMKHPQDARHLRGLFTPLGQRFVDFVTLPKGT